MPEMRDITDLRDLTQEVANLARDAAYVAVGLGVLGFQRSQVRRVELKSKLGQDLHVDQRVDAVVERLTKRVHQLDELVERAVQFVESSLEPIEDQLPGSARDMAKRAHAQAREVRTQIRERVVPAA
jgi:prefoldin subunit 5